MINFEFQSFETWDALNSGCNLMLTMSLQIKFCPLTCLPSFVWNGI